MNWHIWLWSKIFVHIQKHFKLADVLGWLMLTFKDWVMLLRFHDKVKFFWESAGEMWNRHIKVPKIAPEHLFPINGINCSDKMAILSFFCINETNLFKASTNTWSCYNQ